MNTLTYLLSIISVFLGLIVGWILSKLAKEELKPGRIYFLIAGKILMFSAFAVFIYSLNLNMLLFSLLVLVTLALSVFVRIEPYMAYPIVGFMLYFAYLKNSHLFFIIAAACFAYGLPSAMLMASDKIKIKRMIVQNIGFFITALFPLLIKAFF